MVIELPAPAPVAAIQPTLDDLGLPLNEVTFVVVDTETTGGSAASCELTEIGAVKVRGGEVLGEFSTLIKTNEPVPPYITALTGITNGMLADAPELRAVFPSFLEFAQGAILVAHNAPFDVSFLRAACRELGYPWPRPQVLDTVALARRLVTRDEVPNHKLGTLAALFGSPITPNHRALDDARATVHVLHRLLERLGPLGVMYADDLATACDPVPPKRRAKRHLADGLPSAPGVYQFLDAQGHVLYVGTATNLRSRVRSYFTAAEKRRQINEMTQIATEVRPIVCATPFEAQVRELRLIAAFDPPYNRRSRRPDNVPWVVFEPSARTQLRTTRDPNAVISRAKQPSELTFLGPFWAASEARSAIEAVDEAFGLTFPALRAPADDGHTEVEEPLAERIGQCFRSDPTPLVAALAERIAEHVAAQRFEQAARSRDRLTAFLRGLDRIQLLGTLATIPELLVRRRSATTSELLLVRYGAMAGTAHVGSAGLGPAMELLRATGEVHRAATWPTLACSLGEAELVAGYLAAEGIELLAADGTWALPRLGAGRWREDAAIAGAVGLHLAEGAG